MLLTQSVAGPCVPLSGLDHFRTSSLRSENPLSRVVLLARGRCAMPSVSDLEPFCCTSASLTSESPLSRDMFLSVKPPTSGLGAFGIFPTYQLTSEKALLALVVLLLSACPAESTSAGWCTPWPAVAKCFESTPGDRKSDPPVYAEIDDPEQGLAVAPASQALLMTTNGTLSPKVGSLNKGRHRPLLLQAPNTESGDGTRATPGCDLSILVLPPRAVTGDHAAPDAAETPQPGMAIAT